MKDFSLATMWTIAEELLGTVPLYVAVVLAVVFLLLFLVALARRHGFRGGAARIGILVGLMATVVIMLIAPLLTQAGFTNLHGVQDWAALLAFGVLSFAGTVVAIYGVLGVAGRL